MATWQRRSRALCLAALAFTAPLLFAHEISGDNAAYVQALDGPAPAAFAYLGAKHMVTGADHLLFLVGVVFFLRRMKDVLLYVSLFTLGHSITLLAGVLGEWQVNAHLVDAVIGLSVVYKGFENIGGFERTLGFALDPRLAVFGFGLCHGLGLATKVQELYLAEDGLVTNLASFNVGVELGQFAALAAVVGALAWWRQQAAYASSAFALNTLLMGAGFLLAEIQIAAWLLAE